jgi:hypothetical protein
MAMGNWMIADVENFLLSHRHPQQRHLFVHDLLCDRQPPGLCQLHIDPDDEPETRPSLSIRTGPPTSPPSTLANCHSLC